MGFENLGTKTKDNMGSGQSADTKRVDRPENDATQVFWRMNRGDYEAEETRVFEALETATKEELLRMIRNIEDQLVTQKDIDKHAMGELLSALIAEVSSGTDLSRGKSLTLDIMASTYYLRTMRDGFFMDLDSLAGTVLAFWCEVIDSKYREGSLGTVWAFSKEARRVIAALEYVSYMGVADSFFSSLRPLARALSAWVKYRVYGLTNGLGKINSLLVLAYDGFEGDDAMLRLFQGYRKTSTDDVTENKKVFDSDIICLRFMVDDALLILSGKTDFAEYDSKPEDVPPPAEKSRVLVTPYLELVTLVGLTRMRYASRADELTYAKAVTVDLATWRVIMGDYSKLTRDQAVAVVEIAVHNSAYALDELYTLTDLAYSILINGWNFVDTAYRVTNDRDWETRKPLISTSYQMLGESTVHIGPTIHMDHAIAQAWVEGIELAGVTFAGGGRW